MVIDQEIQSHANWVDHEATKKKNDVDFRMKNQK
jgi:hypothetical protein